MDEFAFAVNACLSRTFEELIQNQDILVALEDFLPSLNSVVKIISQSMASKDKKSYASFDAFCQSMTHRLTPLLNEMDHMISTDYHAGLIVESIKLIISNVYNLHLNLDFIKMTRPLTGATSSLSALQKHLKIQKVQPKSNCTGTKTASKAKTKAQQEVKLKSKHSKISLIQSSTPSSLSGECSDFDHNVDNTQYQPVNVISNSSMKTKGGAKLVKSPTPSSKPKSPPKQKQKSQPAVNKKGGKTYEQLQVRVQQPVNDQGKNSSQSVSGSQLAVTKITSVENDEIENLSSISGEWAEELDNEEVVPQPAKSKKKRKNLKKSQNLEITKVSTLKGTSPKTNYRTIVSQEKTKVNSQICISGALSSSSKETMESKSLATSGSIKNKNNSLQAMKSRVYHNQQSHQLPQQTKHQPQSKNKSPPKSHDLPKPSAHYQECFNNHPDKSQVSEKASGEKTAIEKMETNHENDVFKSKELKKEIKIKEEIGELGLLLGNLPGAVGTSVVSNPTDSPSSINSKIVPIGSLKPQIDSDVERAGISSMVVLDDIKCLLLTDLINCCLKLFSFSRKGNSYKFHFVTSTPIQNPFYMTKMNDRNVIVTRTGYYASVVLVTSSFLKVVNTIATPLQYYGVSYVADNMIVAASYDTHQIDLLKFKGSELQVTRVKVTSTGPELLATVPSTGNIVYIEKLSNGTFLKCIDMKGLSKFTFSLGPSVSGVWNLACSKYSILCCNKQENKLKLISNAGRKLHKDLRTSLNSPGVINQPFALDFSKSGDLFLANDGAFESEKNYYITTEINVFEFV